MQLLKSLFCFQGFDTRSRFLVINIVCYIIFLVSNSALSQLFILNMLILFSLTAVITLASLRRLNDAQLKKTWCSGPSISFLIACLIIIFANHNSADWLLLVPIILSSVLLTYPSKTNKAYILGYAGPVDLSDFDHVTVDKQRHNQRIEPVILTGIQSQDNLVTNAYVAEQAFENTEASFSNNLSNERSSTSSSKTNKADQDIGVSIRLKLLNNKNAKLTLIVISALVVLAITLSLITSAFKGDVDTQKTIPAPSLTAVRTAKILFPDNFSLLLSEHKGLIINWQADSTTDSTEGNNIWDLTSAKGDSSCQEIVFNNGKKVRTISVVAENGEQYFANFSPLDTEILLQEIAFRGNFKLCDYKFSLKGSQAILGKHPEYVNMVNY